MSSEQYWARRMDDLNEAMLAKGEEYIRQQNKEYEKALARIKKQTEAWYARMAKNNDISMAEAKKLLDKNELKEFHWTVEDYIKAGRENAVDQRWMKELENASAKVHITRLQELETHLRNEIEQLAAKRLKGTADALGGIYKDSYYKSVYELQKGTGVGASFAKLDNRQIDKVLAKPWAPDGSNFSARIWKDRDKLVNELQTILTQDLIRGEPSEKVIADFAERMNVSKHAAARLIRTEAAYFSGQSRLDAYREMGVEQYKYVSTLDMRTSEICQDMDGKLFKLSEAKAGVNYPPLHVYCRSTTIPHYEDAEPGERAARDEDGKTYTVPGDMTYEDWVKEHAPPDTNKEPKDPDVPKPVVPPSVKQVELEMPKQTKPPGQQEYRVFQTDEEATEWVDEVSPNWLASLTREEKAAIRLYTSESYETINNLLRKGTSDKQWDGVISLISSGLRKFDLKENLVVYRGISHDVYTFSELDDIIVEAAFMSTTMLKENSFAGNVLMEIRLPSGKYGAAIVSLSDYPEEYEFLLDFGTRFRIIDKREENGKIIYLVEVLPHGDQT